MPFDINDSWKKYTEIMKERPEEFRQSEFINIVLDEQEFKEYYSQNKKSIGFIYESEYNILLVDLIKENGMYYTYDRFLPKVREGAVLIIPRYDDKFILLDQYRHSLRDFQLAFPRGFGSEGQSAQENALKELKEELGAEIKSLKYIGMVAGDSGISGRKAAIYLSDVSTYRLNYKYEGIKDIITLSEEELNHKIENNEIDDGFTLAAYCLYKSKK